VFVQFDDLRIGFKMDDITYEISCKHCGRNFLICKRCYRNHRYCSKSCASAGYRKTRRTARQKYNASTEARLDRRDRQRVYRGLPKSVADQTSTEYFLELKSLAKEMNPVQTRNCILCGAHAHVIRLRSDAYKTRSAASYESKSH
jgi:hypothetical protein